ncbi:MAG: hypothetical protein ACRD2L_15085, partial [Terriglobia bacterium]
MLSPRALALVEILSRPPLLIHLPASLGSIPITGLHRYYGGSDSCPPGSSAPYWQHEHRLLQRTGLPDSRLWPS